MYPCGCRYVCLLGISFKSSIAISGSTVWPSSAANIWGSVYSNFLLSRAIYSLSKGYDSTNHHEYVSQKRHMILIVPRRLVQSNHVCIALNQVHVQGRIYMIYLLICHNVLLSILLKIWINSLTTFPNDVHVHPWCKHVTFTICTNRFDS